MPLIYTYSSQSVEKIIVGKLEMTKQFKCSKVYDSDISLMWTLFGGLTCVIHTVDLINQSQEISVSLHKFSILSWNQLLKYHGNYMFTASD